jgi:ketosteroid isomerase-like protein
MLLTDDRDLLSNKAIAVRSIEIMASGGRADFDEVLHPDFFNHEQVDEPPETRGRGAEKAYGVALWLRAAWEGLDWEVHHVVEQDDLVVVRCTMSGRHTGDFAAYDVEGRVADVFAPTGATFATTQSHWLRMRDGRPAEHWANRDDLGTAEQLGWTRPTPAYLVRCALAKRRARRAAAPARYATVRPFGRWQGEPEGVTADALRAIEAMRRVPEEVFAGFGHPERLLDESFADLGWVVHHVVAEGDLVAVSMTVSGRQIGPVARYGEDGRMAAVFPSRDRRFAVRHTHWLRMAGDGSVADHVSDRDDLGMAMQLGWIPPSPSYLLRMARAKRALQR